MPAVVMGNQVHCTLPTTKTLGVLWSTTSNAFTFRYKMPELSRFTNRSMLSGLASVFDPHGQVAPYTIHARVLLQDTWFGQSD